jgi:hypothetical protein
MSALTNTGVRNRNNQSRLPKILGHAPGRGIHTQICDARIAMYEAVTTAIKQGAAIVTSTAWRTIHPLRVLFLLWLLARRRRSSARL